MLEDFKKETKPGVHQLAGAVLQQKSSVETLRYSYSGKSQKQAFVLPKTLSRCSFMLANHLHQFVTCETT